MALAVSGLVVAIAFANDMQDISKRERQEGQGSPDGSVRTMGLRLLKTVYLNADSLVEGKDNAVYDIALAPTGGIAVAEYRRNRITFFDSDGRILRSMDNIPSPHGLAFDSRGFLYVATHRHGRVFKFAPSGEEVVRWDQPLLDEGCLAQPVAVAVDGKDNVYIADYALKTVIQVSSEGRRLLSLQTAGLPGFLPHDVGAQGEKIYVADRGNGRTIHIFSSDGKWVSSWITPEEGFDPLSVCFLEGQQAAVANYRDGLFHVFDKSGRPQAVLGRAGRLPGEFLSVMDCVVDRDGNLYTAEEGGNRIQKFALDGEQS